MPLTNVLLSMADVTFSPGGACGASTTIAVPLSAPADNAYDQGRYTLAVIPVTANVPLHVEMRTVVCNTQVTTKHPLTVALFSNTQTFGGSAVQVQPLVLLLSGQAAAIPYEGVAGNALELAFLAASDTAGTVSLSFALWRM